MPTAHREVDVRHDALVQQQRVDRQLFGPAVRAGMPRPRACPHPERRQRGDAGEHAHALRTARSELQPLAQIGRERETRGMRERAPAQFAGVGRVEDGVRAAPPAASTATRSARAAARSRRARCARRAAAPTTSTGSAPRRRHHARQRPSRNRERPLQRAGGEDHAPAPELRATPPTETPSSRSRVRLHTVAPGTYCAPLARTRARALARASSRRRARWPGSGARVIDAIDLPARRRLLVEAATVDRPARAVTVAAAIPAGPAPTTATSYVRIQVRSVITARPRACRAASRPRMPSRTRTRQPCRLPTPSIVTRQSKHTPIMQ